MMRVFLCSYVTLSGEAQCLGEYKEATVEGLYLEKLLRTDPPNTSNGRNNAT